MENNLKCECCNKEFLESQLIMINDKYYCLNCYNKLDNTVVNKIGFTKILGESTENEIISVFYFQVEPEYFANANRVKLEYTSEKKIENRDAWVFYSKVDLTRHVIGVDTKEEVVQLLRDDDEFTCKVYDSIKEVSKEEYIKLGEK